MEFHRLDELIFQVNDYFSKYTESLRVGVVAMPGNWNILKKFLIVAFAGLLVVYAAGTARGQVPPEALEPTVQDIQGWGFTFEEFQSLMQRKLDLLLEESRLMEQLTKEPYRTLDTMRREAIESTQNELWMRRVDLRTHSVRSFRERGMHTSALQKAERALTSRLTEQIGDLRKQVDFRLQAEAPTRQVVPEKPPASRGAPPEMEVIEPKPLGNIPVEEQAPINRQKTEVSGVRREPVKPNPNYQGPPLMDDPDMRGVVKPLNTPPPVKSPSPNPNYQGPPLMDDPDMRGVVKPLDKPKPQSAAETYGSVISISLMNLETILRCKETDVPARDCLLGLMVSNGLATTVHLASQLLSSASLIKLSIGVGGQALLIGKGAWDTYQFLDGLQGAARAEYEAYLAKRSRQDWLQKNMEIRDMPGYIAKLRQRIDDTLGPLASSLEGQCADLKKMAAATPAAGDAAAAIREMPEKSAIYAMDPLHDRALDALANERVLRRDLETLRQDFAVLAGDTARSNAFRQSASSLAGQARAHIAVEKELAEAKGTLDKAFALLARMRNISSGVAPFEKLEAQSQRIDQARAVRSEQAGKLRIEVQALKRAFPEKEIETWMKAELLSLDAAIDGHLRQDCKQAEIISAHRQSAGTATENWLEVQNRLEPVDVLHASLSRLAYGTGQEVLDAVLGMLQQIQASPEQPENRASDDSSENGGFKNEGTTVQNDTSRNGRASPDRKGEDGKNNSFTSEGTHVSERTGERRQPEAAASGQDDFVSEGTVIGTDDISLLDTPPSPAPPTRQPPPARQPPPETVTYFDRPWLPQSWKTSGNAQQTRAEIYQAASRLGWAAALAEFAPATVDNLIVDHLNATAGHLQRANQASFAPHKAWPDWQRRQTSLRPMDPGA